MMQAPPGFDPGMMEEMMMGEMTGYPPNGGGEEDEKSGIKIPTEIGADEDFLFENFLK